MFLLLICELPDREFIAGLDAEVFAAVGRMKR
jgi:hypothetical protein